MGGVLSAGALGLSGLLQWTLSRVSGDAEIARAGGFLAFAVGGPGHLVPLGLLLAGVSVPSLLLGLLPKAVAWSGLVIALVAELTTLVLVWPALVFLMPVARFPTLVWLVVAGALLPLRRRNSRAAAGARAAADASR